jgi:hypothetical protein
MLIEVLLSGKEQRTPELPAAQLLPVFIDPTEAFSKESGDLLGSQYIVGFVIVNTGCFKAHVINSII